MLSRALPYQTNLRLFDTHQRVALFEITHPLNCKSSVGKVKKTHSIKMRQEQANFFKIGA
jgi:hypothetical protein